MSNDFKISATEHAFHSSPEFRAALEHTAPDMAEVARRCVPPAWVSGARLVHSTADSSDGGVSDPTPMPEDPPEYLESLVHEDQLERPQFYSKTYADLCSIIRNERAILEEIPEWNEMLLCPTVRGGELSDHDTGWIRERIQKIILDAKGRGLEFKAGDIDMALMQIAHERRYHPVREYLDTLKWDGTPRIAAVADEILGVERNDYHVAILRKWIVGCVARIYQPGCDLQMVLVLSGPEDKGKSRFFSTLFSPRWFSDRVVDIKSKDTVMLLQRVWCLEWGELASIRSSDWESTKSFITSRDDDYRPPYGRKVIRQPRHCVIVGTANEQEYLQGREGERRFWPIAIQGSKIDFEKLDERRDQLWAEARCYYLANMAWWLTDEEKKLLKSAHAAHVDEHPWQGKIADFLTGHVGDITTSIILEKAIQKPAKDWTRGDQMAVATCTKSIGWVQPGTRIDGTNKGERIWIRKQA